jgi:hypothetical protein
MIADIPSIVEAAGIAHQILCGSVLRASILGENLGFRVHPHIYRHQMCGSSRVSGSSAKVSGSSAYLVLLRQSAVDSADGDHNTARRPNSYSNQEDHS